MGRQSRLRRARHLEKLRTQPTPTVAKRGEPLRVLRAIHQTIQQKCGENPRRCWEYLLEMLAHQSGWRTDTQEAHHLWEPMANENRWGEFLEMWCEEVEYAKRSGTVFSEPLGSLLEEVNGANEAHGQYFTPMEVVRVSNAISFHDLDQTPSPDGWPKHRILDPCCGSGRYLIDALVHYDSTFVHAVDIDLWMLRCTMLNVRLLAKWTSLRLKDASDVLKPFDEGRPGGNGLLVIGGRSMFIHGDAMIVDLKYRPNWMCAGWHWAPLPWRSNLKIAGYYGTFDEWDDAGRPPRFQKSEDIQFDYSMPPPGGTHVEA